MLMSAMVSILRDSSGSSPQWDSDGGIADGQPFQNSAVSQCSGEWGQFGDDMIRS